MEKRICLFCTEAINGRSDKKFCSDLCRNAHNNKLNSNENNYVRNLILMLRKNRRILQHVLTTDKITLAKQKLLDLGFNFKYITHTQITRNGHQYNYCFEYGYMLLDSGLVLVVKKQIESEHIS